MPHDAIPAIIYMSGSRRGLTEQLTGDTAYIARDSQFGVRVAGPNSAINGDVAARLHHSEGSYVLEVMPGNEIWVNGERAAATRLLSGDVIEIGRNGPMLRYRQYSDGAVPRRSMAAAFSDCIDGARYYQGPLMKKTGVLFGGISSEFLIRTTLWFRLGFLATLVVMAVSIGFLVRHSLELEQRMAREEARLLDISALIEESESKAITSEDLVAMRSKLESDVSTAVERVEALEARSGAGARVISTASQSVIFLQGAYGFVETDTGRPLRYVGLGSDGQPLRAPQGGPALTLDGEGPVFERQYTGTGFVASQDGLVVTNRHVAQPWKGTEFAKAAESKGLAPAMRRFIGYLPGVEKPFDVSLASASDDADIAILRCGTVTNDLPHLRADTVAPRPGDDIIILGYPTGVRAMLARADQPFLDALRAKGQLDFWSVVTELARAGHISPLATRGIVGQVTPSAIVYDADTTHGGSGGPVLNLNGAVIAVNAAILKEFGGSNLGVPIDRATVLFGGATPGDSASQR